MTNETYISFNLENNSVLNNLRIVTFRKKIQNHNLDLSKSDSEIIELIDKTNKKQEVNLIIVNLI